MSCSRLLKLCSPLRYVIELQPCFEKFTFVGKESITVEVANGASQIELNARDISINEAKFNGETVMVVPDPISEKVAIHLARPALAGKATLDIAFNGKVTDKMEGFYRSVYKDSNGEDKCMMSTQFEAANARQAFPCWDEPEFKSIFSLKLVVPKHMLAISNMPVTSQIELDGNLTAYQFDDTPLMSSYLMAFAIGELEFVEARDSNGVLIRVYSRLGYVSENNGSYALDIACRSLPFFGEYFRIRYPLPKLDLLAVPDFAGGAMENWGLVTFRERALLANETTSSASSKQDIALTVSHELAHMWFGNLVTMRWWTDLWLKEGFANCIEYFCVNHCFPQMDIWTQFTGELACALRLDALESSHPIEVEVTSVSEIEEIFDTISYCKGASVIHMLHAFLGDDAFRSGLCAYLSKHAYGNATTEDLWTALSASSGRDIGEIMRPWTRTVGFPVLSVEPLELVDKAIRVRLAQVQYKLTQSTDTTDSRTWPIPIVFTCTSEDGSHSTTYKYVLTAASDTINVPLDWSPSSLSDCLVRVNADASGYYHVRYPNDQLMRLTRHLKKDGWPPSSRFVFINDGFALAKAGYMNIGDWLKLLPQLMEGEDCYAIWRAVLVDGFSTYVRRIVNESDIPLELYHTFLRKLTRPPLNKLGFFKQNQNGDGCAPLSHNTVLLQSLLVSTAGAVAGDADVVAEAKRLFEAHQRGDCVLPGDLRSCVYTTVVRHGSVDVMRQLIQLYSTIKSSEERSYILRALGGVRVTVNENGDSLPAVSGETTDSPLQQVLQFCLDTRGPVRDQDRVHGLISCASWSSAARATTWNAVKADWTHLTAIYQGQFLMSSLLKGVLCGFATADRLKEVKDFFELNPVPCARTMKQVIETLEVNQSLLQRDGPRILAALTELANTKS